MLHIKPGLFATLALGLSATLAQAETKMPFALDWKFEGPSAPYFLAIDERFYDEAGLEVEISEGRARSTRSRKWQPAPIRWASPISTH